MIQALSRIQTDHHLHSLHFKRVGWLVLSLTLQKSKRQLFYFWHCRFKRSIARIVLRVVLISFRKQQYTIKGVSSNWTRSARKRAQTVSSHSVLTVKVCGSHFLHNTQGRRENAEDPMQCQKVWTTSAGVSGNDFLPHQNDKCLNYITKRPPL